MFSVLDVPSFPRWSAKSAFRAGLSGSIITFRSWIPESCQKEALLMWEILSVALNFILLPLGAFMILLILIQRGKGGGLIGALGGAGGSSPFGSRAGDQFTRLTIYIAIAWLLLTMIQVKAIQLDHMERSGRTSAFNQNPGQ